MQIRLDSTPNSQRHFSLAIMLFLFFSLTFSAGICLGFRIGTVSAVNIVTGYTSEDK